MRIYANSRAYSVTVVLVSSAAALATTSLATAALATTSLATATLATTTLVTAALATTSITAHAAALATARLAAAVSRPLPSRQYPSPPSASQSPPPASRLPTRNLRRRHRLFDDATLQKLLVGSAVELSREDTWVELRAPALSAENSRDPKLLISP